MKNLVFTSPTSILAWANVSAGRRIGDAWYVQKDGLFHYFAQYRTSSISCEYRLVMVSSRDLGNDNDN